MDIKEYINTPVEIEKQLLSFFNRNQNITIFDIGACDGSDSIKYANLFPKSRILSFEPLPSNIDVFKEHLEEGKETNIEIVQVALSNQKGEAEFHVSSGCPDGRQDDNWDYGNKSSSLLMPESNNIKKYFNWLKFETKLNVKTTTIEEICREYRIDKIDFIHLDVQGAELMVLEGAGDLIENINIIWLEVEKICLYKGQPLMEQVSNFMSSKGFYKAYECSNEIDGDRLYVNNKYKKQSMLCKLIMKTEGFKKWVDRIKIF